MQEREAAAAAAAGQDGESAAEGERPTPEEADPHHGKLRALILTPTRELALQVASSGTLLGIYPLVHGLGRPAINEKAGLGGEDPCF